MMILNRPNFNELAKDIYQYNVSVGWWEGEQDNIETKLMLVITELAEATEGERKGLMDDHLPHRKMGEVELADALIRILDIGARLKLDYRPIGYIANNSENIFHIHLDLCGYVLNMYDHMWSMIRNNNKIYVEEAYSGFIGQILYASRIKKYDVISAMYEKIEYNKVRSDHKLENRMKDGGKKV